MLLYVSILRSSSVSTYCSLPKLHVKIVNMYVHPPPPCTENNVYTNTICCHITDNYNDVFTILTCNFGKEQYVLTEDDLRI
jgi:hypothetical protein